MHTRTVSIQRQTTGTRLSKSQSSSIRTYSSKSLRAKTSNFRATQSLKTSIHPDAHLHLNQKKVNVPSANIASNHSAYKSFGYGVSLSTSLGGKSLYNFFTSKRHLTTATEGTTNNNNNGERGANLGGTASTVKEQIAEMYEKGHFPLNAAHAKYGPPYRDTKELESLPEDVFHDHIPPKTLSDKIAYGLVVFFKQFTHLFFREKYTHHAVVLETVAAVPGMVAGMWRHLHSLRRMERDYGWIGKLIEEAENERMHLLTWMQITKPTALERLIVLGAQLFYTPFYSLLYVFSPKTAHRFVGYLEEEACHQYTLFLKAIDEGKIPNGPAPDIAKKYWNLAPDATLRDVVLAVRADEAMHRDVNHTFSQKAALGLH